MGALGAESSLRLSGKDIRIGQRSPLHRVQVHVFPNLSCMIATVSLDSIFRH